MRERDAAPLARESMARYRLDEGIHMSFLISYANRIDFAARWLSLFELKGQC